MDSSKSAGKAAIETLTWLQAIRKRPGMYIGDRNEKGLETCILELLSGALAEHLQGRCSLVEIYLNRDGSITIQDDRRNRSYKPKNLSDLGFLEREFTEPDVKWKPSTRVPRVELGWAGLGPWCVAALSEWLTARWNYGGKTHELRMARGIVKQRRCSRLLGRRASAIRSLTRFKPDPEIFGNAAFDFNRLAWQLREIAFLSPGLCIRVSDRPIADGAKPKSVSYVYPRGIEDYVCEMAIPTAQLHKHPMVVKGERKEISVAVAVAYQDSDHYRLLSYVNYRPTKWGSTHLAGFLDGLAEAINLPCCGERTRFSGRFVRHGINCILNVQMPQPRYSGAVKERLCNSEAYDIVRSICSTGFKRLFRKDPECHKAVVLHLDDLQFADEEMRAEDLGQL